MSTKEFARSLPLRTSRRLGSAPVRLACTQRDPKRGFVLVCRLGQEADSGAVSEAEGDADGAGEAAAPAAIPKPKKPTRRERRAGRVLVGHDRRAHDRADRRL